MTTEVFKPNKEKSGEDFSLYSLSGENFGGKVEKPLEYKIGDKITRENLASFFIFSFVISRGNGFRQDCFLVWLRVKYGFDFLTTLQNLKNAGGWDIFSISEKELFIKKFRHVEDHSSDDYKNDNKISHAIKKQLEYITNNLDEEKITELSQTVNFSEIHSIVEFNKAVERSSKKRFLPHN